MTDVKINRFGIDEIKPGMFLSFEKVLSGQEVQAFAELTGDVSPLHISQAYGEITSYGKNVVHGMLIGELFSRVIGVLLPGEKALLNSMEMRFLKPVLVGSAVTISAKVISVSRAAQMTTLNLLALVEGEICASAKASVTVRE